MTLNWQPQPQMAPGFNRVSSLLAQQTRPVPSAPVFQTASVQPDRFQLSAPSQLFQRQAQLPLTSPIALPPIRVSGSSRQQLMALGQKYGVAYSGQDINRYQTQVIQAVIRQKAQSYGIPEHIALAIAKNESGIKMWKDIDRGTLVEGRNIRDGVLKSTDWGVMQINDKAHPRAFPRAREDLEYNIDYGLQYLARQRSKIQGSLNLGFGDWDRTIASYNLGHNPSTENAYAIAQRYVGHVHKQASSFA